MDMEDDRLDLDREDLSEALANNDQALIDNVCAHLVDRARELERSAQVQASRSDARELADWSALFMLAADTLERIAINQDRSV